MSWAWIAFVASTIVVLLVVVLLARRGSQVRLKENASGTAVPPAAAREGKAERKSFFSIESPKELPIEEPPPAGPIARAIGVVIGGLLSGIPFLGGIVIAGFQNYIWLRSGKWYPLTVLDGASILSNRPWIRNPEDWLGLHSMLSRIPLSAALLCVGAVFYWMAFIAEE